MTVMQGVRRVTLRTAFVLLSAGIVVGVTCALTRPSDLKRASVEQAKKYPAAEDGDAPFPGGEDALRLAINQSQKSKPDYARIGDRTANLVRQQLPEVEPLLANLGQLRSLTYLGSGDRSDIYRAVFENGSLVWKITMGKGRTIASMRCSAPEGPTAQDWIDHYALDPAGKGVARIVLAFAKFLAIAGLGRFAGIRL